MLLLLWQQIIHRNVYGVGSTWSKNNNKWMWKTLSCVIKCGRSKLENNGVMVHCRMGKSSGQRSLHFLVSVCNDLLGLFIYLFVCLFICLCFVDLFLFIYLCGYVLLVCLFVFVYVLLVYLFIYWERDDGKGMTVYSNYNMNYLVSWCGIFFLLFFQD